MADTPRILRRRYDKIRGWFLKEAPKWYGTREDINNETANGPLAEKWRGIKAKATKAEQKAQELYALADSGDLYSTEKEAKVRAKADRLMGQKNYYTNHAATFQSRVMARPSAFYAKMIQLGIQLNGTKYDPHL